MIAGLDAAVRAVCPSVNGVSIGSLVDRATWRVDFSGDETADQRAAALTVLGTFDALASVKAALVDEVQEQFDALCNHIVTPGSAMASVYRVQVDASYRMIGGLIATHPALAQLVGIDGIGSTELEVANTIAARNEQCEALVSALNRKRLIAKSAIMAAASESAARAAAAVDWNA